MKKVFLIFSLIILGTAFVFGQSDDELFGGSDFTSDFTSDDELFGGSSSDDDLFGGSDSSDEDLFGSEDEMFLDDGIEEITDTTAKDNLSKGVLFEAGSVKVGGRVQAGINTNTALYNPKEDNFGENIKNTTLTPNLSAFLTVDARPTENLRMYTKFGMAYPFTSKLQLNINPNELAGSKLPNTDSAAGGTGKPEGNGGGAGKPDGSSSGILGEGAGSGKLPEFNPGTPMPPMVTGLPPEMIIGLLKKTTIKDWFSLKELFTDFSIKDTAFFRFGIHTVSWGTGYFFSPVSDMINTSMIDPENPTEQVDGALNLRTQVVFPGTQNCLWAYVIPSTNFTSETSAASYARDTALAAKYEFVVGGWEIGTGALWKYESAPKVMSTFSGSIKKLSVFGEFVYQYGGASEWAENKNWDNKTSIFQATVGGFYTWKDPGIMLALQYYYDGNNVDLTNRLYSDGHNIALMANFSKFGNVKKLSASIFGIVNFGRTGFTDKEKQDMADAANKANKEGAEKITADDIKNPLPCLMINANLLYRPTDDISLSIGPGITFTDFKEKPTVSLKIGATLGGGKF